MSTAAVLFAWLSQSQTPAGVPDHPRRPVSTYSIVARDPATGEIGVAVQSHWFSVGSVVPWAEAGVGAVATQSLVEASYGPRGLDLMREGKSAEEALRELLKADNGREVRQVAMIDAKGRVAAHTGTKCIAQAGMVVGEAGQAGSGVLVDDKGQFSIQANLMGSERVWPAMAKAFRETKGDLAERMLAAMEAAEREGGDIRGRQSAAMIVVAAKSTGKPWADRRFDLRIEDHPTPVAELKRLVTLQRAYNHMNAGDAAIEKSDFKTAAAEYSAAERLAPQIVEIPFWAAVSMANAGKLDESLPIFRRVFEKEPAWATVAKRLPASGLLPDKKDVLEKIAAQASSQTMK